MELYGRANGKEPPQVVLNQYREGLGLTSRDVEDGLGHRISLVLEKDDLRVLQSINVGRPEVLGGVPLCQEADGSRQDPGWARERGGSPRKGSWTGSSDFEE
jgi:hypothetical protein